LKEKIRKDELKELRVDADECGLMEINFETMESVRRTFLSFVDERE
jgi:hypothetical protein